jgi:hypothetical protein
MGSDTEHRRALRLTLLELDKLRTENARLREALDECTCEECGHSPSFKPAAAHCGSAAHDPFRDAPATIPDSK